MSANALSFLGFGAGNLTANGQRLRQRYRDLGVTPPSWLEARSGPAAPALPVPAYGLRPTPQ